MLWLLLLMALLVGIALPLQTGINAQLRVGLGHPALAALVSISAGTMCLLIYTFACGLPLPTRPALLRLPWWSCLGGLLGAFYLAASLTLAPKLGAVSLIAALVAGQMIASAVLDHYGLVGYEVRPLGLRQLLGIGLVIAGVIVIQRK